MPASRKNCCILGCNNTSRQKRGFGVGVKFYKFPESVLGAPWKIVKRKQWMNAVKNYVENPKDWVPNKYTRICSTHFVNGGKSENPLHPSYIPTIFPDEEITSSPVKHMARKSAHKIRTDFDQATIDIDKLDDSTTSSPEPNRKRIRISKKQTDTGAPSSSSSIDGWTVLSDTDINASTQEIHNEKYDSQSEETKLHLAEFRIAQYQMAVEHLQSRLEASLTELTELKEKHFKDVEYYKEEINSRDRKIAQLENENRALIDSLSKNIVKIEDGVQNVEDENIFGY
ncbi:peroxynitrite isomerase THAP4-like [Chrysoperla carnea]|uniref:peroxynitrite isomerase THAP4-like n=1 Tax=Chrysoperla carnea TaxID=189513 RepID=UPI001D067533|nr:peroxynitrite isomerase THAP4-like [Chrysoperla carnea]